MNCNLPAGIFAALLALAAAPAAHAAPAPAAARAEVDALLTRLQSSGCEFNRNGRWYGAAEARAHLLKKLEYLEDKDMVQTAEQFIERGASSSSMSGKAYLVRCPDKAALDSAQWLKAELQQLRAARGQQASQAPQAPRAPSGPR